MNTFDQLFKVLTPLETRYQAIVGRDNLKAIYMEAKVSKITFTQPLVLVQVRWVPQPQVRGAVVDVLESLTGVVQGCAVSTVHQVVRKFVCSWNCIFAGLWMAETNACFPGSSP